MDDDLQAVADDDLLLDLIGARTEVLVLDELTVLLIGWRAEIEEDECRSRDAVTSILQNHNSSPTSRRVSFRSMTRKYSELSARIWRGFLASVAKPSRRKPSRD